MTRNPHRTQAIEVICHTSQTDEQRLAMVMMQLDMALALAREKGLAEVEGYLEEALSEARRARARVLQ
ncbi:hypothetical protein [Pseudohoeflea coraliihabitans]|uniref:Uncharacterized protein n=1 Tax=Pseudohoeflea coraliihabitans TaxID=2860393 RepID=A0ABS6WS39_9HYPH|nr:hypothetical protein [Pseudohoeflea sp. DP4N28-3]MBW3098782.1 hypothetical protein [Pseudohoeflea sp. DP4N28-3]